LQISGVSLTLTYPLRLCLLSILLGTTAIVTSFCLLKRTGGGGATHAFSSQCAYLQFTWKVTLPSSPVEFSSHCHFYQLSCSKVAGRLPPLLPSPASLFIYSSVRDCPSPLQHSGHPALFATCLFCCCYCLLSFGFFCLFFSGWGSSVQGVMLIWPRAVFWSTMCHLAHLMICIFPSGLGAGIWWHRSPPCFSV
jgi:hypothetical protein